MKLSKVQLRSLFVPLFSIVMGIVILISQSAKVASQDFIIHKNESYVAGILLLLIGIGLFIIRLNQGKKDH